MISFGVILHTGRQHDWQAKRFDHITYAFAEVKKPKGKETVEHEKLLLKCPVGVDHHVCGLERETATEQVSLKHELSKWSLMGGKHAHARIMSCSRLLYWQRKLSAWHVGVSVSEPFRVQRQLYCHIKQYKVGTLAVDGWAVTFDTARRGLGRAPARLGPSSLYQM